MHLYIKKREGLRLPERANETDAGYDIFADSNPLVTGVDNTGAIVKDGEVGGLWKRVDFIQYRTGLFWAQKLRWKLQIGDDECAIQDIRKHIELFPRSSNSKFNLALCNSVATIDHGYRGEVLIRFNYLWQPEDLEVGSIGILGRINIDKIYQKGEPLIQMKPREDEDINFEFSEDLEKSDRGEGNFGSTNEKRGFKNE